MSPYHEFFFRPNFPPIFFSSQLTNKSEVFLGRFFDVSKAEKRQEQILFNLSRSERNKNPSWAEINPKNLKLFPVFWEIFFVFFDSDRTFFFIDWDLFSLFGSCSISFFSSSFTLCKGDEKKPKKSFDLARDKTNEKTFSLSLQVRKSVSRSKKWFSEQLKVSLSKVLFGISVVDQFPA